jgi:hypothetical protein
MYKSPFSEEKTGSFHIFKSKNTVLFKCFSTGRSGNIYLFTQFLLGIDKTEAFKYVHNLILDKQKFTFDRAVVKIIGVSNQVRDDDNEYFDFRPIYGDSVGSTDFLAFYDFKSTADHWLPIIGYEKFSYGDPHGITFRGKTVRLVDAPAFAFLYPCKGIFEQKCKLYFPKRKPKMIGNSGEKDLYVVEMPYTKQLDFYLVDSVYIIGGQKDAEILSKCLIARDKQNWIVISPNSESVIISKHIIKEYINQYHNNCFITDSAWYYIIMDNDKAGFHARDCYKGTIPQATHLYVNRLFNDLGAEFEHDAIVASSTQMIYTHSLFTNL